MGSVDLGFEVEEVREGRARILAPPGFSRSGPGTRGRLPFYNPVAAVVRDLNVLLLRALPAPVPRFLDGLAATGVMGIRACLEAGVPEVIFNDRNPVAVGLIRENLRLNGLEARMERRDLRALAVEVVSSWVEIDPFGSPTPFLAPAIQGLHNGGLLGATATDTAVLTGAYPSTCRRRYGARPLRCPFSHEVALRILVGHMAREAARFEAGIEVLVAYSMEHFLRATVAIHRGSRRADGALGKLGYVQWDATTGHRSVVPEQPHGGTWAGPLWAGALGDRALLRRMEPTPQVDTRTVKLLPLLRGEVDLPPLMYTTDELSSLLDVPPPPRDKLIQALVDQGIPTARTHFHPKGLRTAGSSVDVINMVRALASV